MRPVLASDAWLSRATRGSGVTDGHVAVPFLGIASSLIGTGRRVRASNSWSEPCTTWTCQLGFSGTGKTPGMQVSTPSIGPHREEQKG